MQFIELHPCVASAVVSNEMIATVSQLLQKYVKQINNLLSIPLEPIRKRNECRDLENGCTRQSEFVRDICSPNPLQHISRGYHNHALENYNGVIRIGGRKTTTPPPVLPMTLMVSRERKMD